MIVIRNGTAVEMTAEEELLMRPSPETRLEELKELLRESDYKTLKYAEGALSEEEFETSRRERAAWRAEINRIEENEKETEEQTE